MAVAYPGGGGGMVAVRNGTVRFALPIAGLMSPEPVVWTTKFRLWAAGAGLQLISPFMTIASTVAVLPELESLTAVW